jgi:hypothetical protein
MTGELLINTKRGMATIDAPKIQGVSGFLTDAGSFFDFKHVSIRSDNDYASIVAVAMDDKPLGESSQVLIQVGTQSRLTGFKSEPAAATEEGQTLQGERVVSNGTPPWAIVNTRATVSIANAKLSRATLLDPAGLLRRDLDVKREGNRLVIDLPPDSIHVLVR